MKRSGIYKLYWENNPYFYYGQTVCFNKRYLRHIRLLKKGEHENKKVQNIFNKYGIPLIEEVLLCDQSELNCKEQEYIDKYFNDENCCNLSPTASSTKGYKHTEEAKIIIGEKSKLKIYTPEYRDKLRNRKPNITMLGKKHTDEARKKMSESHKGKTKSLEHRRKIGDAHKGNKHYNFGKTLSNETKQKLSDVLSGDKNPKAKQVININDGKTFLCVKYAAEYYNINYSTLKSNLKRKPNYFLKYKEPLASNGALSTNEA